MPWGCAACEQLGGLGLCCVRAARCLGIVQPASGGARETVATDALASWPRRRVIEYVARQPFSELTTLAWEDYSFGTWIASAAVTVRANVPGSMECRPNKRSSAMHTAAGAAASYARLANSRARLPRLLKD